MEQEEQLVKYKNISDNICVSASFLIFAIIFEFVSSLCLFGKVPSFFFLSLVLINVYAFVIFLLPTKAFRRTIACMFLSFQFVISIVNDVLHNITGEVFTFDKLWLAGEAAGTFSFHMINFFHMALYVVLFAVSMYFVFGLPKHIKEFRMNKKQFTSTVVGILFASLAVFGSLSSGYLEKRNLILTEYPTTLAYQTFGFYGFYLSNAFISLGALNTNVKLSEEQYNTYLTYLQDGMNPDVNAFTGISEGNNVLVILAESVDVCAIDPYFTPNLYKMWFEDGMLLKNYYSENKTNMSEGMALFGTYGREGALNTNVKLAEAYEHFSLPGLIKKQDENIKTTFAHSFKSSFYNRDITHTKIGFDEIIFANEQEEDIKNYNIEKGQEYSWSVKDIFNKYMKDSNFFEYNKEALIPSSGRFFTHFSAMVTHGTYEKRDSNKEYYNYLTSEEQSEHFDKMITDMQDDGYAIEKLKEQNIWQNFLYYKAAMMDFDKMVGMIFDRLEELNILDKTTIYMFPDHNTFYNDLSYIIRGVEKNKVRECNVNAYNMCACIYDQKLTAKYKGESEYSGGVIIEKFTSVNDVYPTLCDVLNLPYNTNLCYGKSLFSDDSRVFISLKDDRYVFNDKYYFYNNQVFDAKTKEVTVNEEFQQNVSEILYKFEVHEKLNKSRSSFVDILQQIGY